MGPHLIHNIKNQLFLISLLLRKIKNDKEITDKINNILNSINNDYLQMQDHEIDCLVNINQAIDDLISIYPDVVFEKDFHDNLDFIGNKSEFRDVLINIIKNSQEAGAQTVKFEIKANALIISDNGKCTKVVIDKLNEENVFTTKKNGTGVGSQIVRQFCQKQGCVFKYSASICIDSDKKSTSMIIEVVFP